MGGCAVSCFPLRAGALQPHELVLCAFDPNATSARCCTDLLTVLVCIYTAGCMCSGAAGQPPFHLLNPVVLHICQSFDCVVALVACLLLVHACRRSPGRPTRLRSCRQVWLMPRRRAVRTCVRCLRVCACAVASNAYRRTQAFVGGDFGVFAAGVCVQVVTGASDPAEKLPPGMADAAAKSSVCVRALCARGGVC